MFVAALRRSALAALAVVLVASMASAPVKADEAGGEPPSDTGGGRSLAIESGGARTR